MKKKLTLKSVLFYIVLIAIIIPSFQYACETNWLYNVCSYTFTEEEIRTFLKNEYSNGVELKDYKIDKSMIKIKEEESKPVLYYYFVTKYNKDQEDLIFDEVRQIYNKMRKEDEISEYFYKLRFRALNGDKVIYKHTYNLINWTMDRITYLSLALMVAFVIRIYYGIRAWIKERKRNKFLGGNEIYDYSMAELKLYLQTYPTDDRAHARLSQLYLSEGNVAEALESIGEANRLNRFERDYIIHYGYILVLLEEHKEALGVYNGLMKIKSFFTDYYLLYIVASLYYKLGKMKTARRYYKHSYRVCKKRRFRNDPKAQELKKDIEMILFNKHQGEIYGNSNG
jgi:hypothetical protein